MSFRRWVGGASVLVLGASLGLQPAAAHAAVGTGVMEFAAAVFVNDSGCERPSWSDAGRIVAVPGDGRTRELRAADTGRGASSQLSASRAVRGAYTANAWGTRRVTVSASVAVSAGANPSAVCSVDRLISTAAFYTESMTAPKRSWLAVRSSGAARGSRTSVVVGLSGDDLADALSGPDGSITRLVPAGAYTIGARLQAEVSAPARSTTTRSGAASVTATVALFPVGTLRTRSGNGLGYLKAGSRDCTHHRAKVHLSAAGRTKVRKAVFSVNGDRRFTLTGSQLQRDAVFVSSIPRASSGAIRVDIVLRSGARRTSYATSWPCA